MRVLYFHQHFTTRDGSGGTRSYEMARALVDHGHQVTMICGSYKAGQTGLSGPFDRGRRRGTVDGIDVLELALPYSNADGLLKRALTFVRFGLRSVQVAIMEPADLVFATSTPLTSGIPTIAAKVGRRRKVVFEVRDLWPELPREMGVITNPLVLGAMDVLEWCAYRSADRLVALSPGIRDGIVRRGVDVSRVAVVPNGCDVDLFANPSGGVRPPGVAPDDLMAIYAGTHGVANGLDAVLDAAAVLKQRGRNEIKIVLVGDGKLKQGLRQRAGSEGLGNVVFVDPLPKTELARLLAQADVGMQILANVPAFYFGTSPNKFFDYLASGLPVLNNYPGWLAGLITENNCGFAVKPEDPEAFADALIVAAEDRVTLAAMGKNSARLGLSKFDRRVLSNEFVAWLESARIANSRKKLFGRSK